MAQACVMVQQDLECGPHQHGMMTPTRPPPASPQLDTSLITSTVRKRKDLPERQAQNDKRVRQIDPSTSSIPDGVLSPQHLNGLSAPFLHHHETQRVPEVDAEQDPEAQGVLFSPTFHLGAGTQPESAPHHAVAAHGRPQNHKGDVTEIEEVGNGICRPSTPPVENASTDASTGTSTSLEIDANECEMNALGSPVATGAAPAEEVYDDDDEYMEFDPFVFIKRLPPVECCVPKRTSFLLPRQTRRSKQKTLVLDLDETLVHSTLDGDSTPDFTFPVDLGTVRHMVAVRKRPHLHHFLSRVSQLFEVVVFTASQRVYAEQLLDLVDPGRRFIRHRVYRDSCVFWEGNYLKDLTALGRDLAHTMIVDNSPQAFGFQLENGIPIESWYDDAQDKELLKLLPFLEAVVEVDDVRPHIQSRYKLHKLVDAAPGPRYC